MKPEEDSLAVVTGATSGIGEAFARELGRRGYDLLVTGRRAGKIRGVGNHIGESHGVDVEVFLGDFAEREVVQELADRLRSRPGIEILVNNAGFDRFGRFHEQDRQVSDRMIQVHLQATLELTHAVLPAMVGRDRGALINLSSLAACAPLPFHATYAATKAFLKNFSESLRLELRHTNVRVQALCPGVTRTEIHEQMGADPKNVYKERGLWKAMSPEEVVRRSLACLERDVPVCIPGMSNRLIAFLTGILPRSLVERAAEAFAQSQFTRQ